MGSKMRSEATAEADWRWGEVAEFVGIAFGTTWALHGALVLTGKDFDLSSLPVLALYVPGLAGPAIGAFAVEAHRRGRPGVAGLVRRARVRHLSRHTAALATTAQPALSGAAAAIARGSVAVEADAALIVGQGYVAAAEEFGWRGWLWPRAAQRFGIRGGTALVTALWGLWHLPMFAVAESSQARDGLLQFSAAIAVWGALHGHVQKRSQSILAAILLHAVTNITVSTFEVESRATVTAVYGVAAVILFALLRPSREEAPDAPTAR